MKNIEDFDEELISTMNEFIRATLDSRRKEKIYRELEWLASYASPGFAELVCLAALDIPLISSGNITKLDVHFNPQKRFNILVRKLRELNEKTPLREIDIPGKSREDVKKNVMKFLSKLTGLEICNDNDRRAIIKQIHALNFKLLKLHIKKVRDPLRQGLKYGMRIRNIVEILYLFTKMIGVPIILKTRRGEWLTIGPRNIRWENWIYMNMVISEIAHGRKPSSKIRNYLSHLPSREMQKMRKFLELAESVAFLKVPRWLVKKLEVSDLKMREVVNSHCSTS